VREQHLDFLAQAPRETRPSRNLAIWRAARALVKTVAENMAIIAGVTDDGKFFPQAEQLLRLFEAIEGRKPRDYLEIEEWSRHHLDRGGRFLILK
jgi:hypothetical protein